MSDDEIEARLLKWEKRTRSNKGFSGWDRIIGAIIAAILAGLHFAPSGDRNWVASKFDEISTRIEKVTTENVTLSNQVSGLEANTTDIGNRLTRIENKQDAAR